MILAGENVPCVRHPHQLYLDFVSQNKRVLFAVHLFQRRADLGSQACDYLSEIIAYMQQSAMSSRSEAVEKAIVLRYLDGQVDQVLLYDLAAAVLTSRVYLSPAESFQPPIATLTLMPLERYVTTRS
uniref:Uncharacterized protein n=1 Tax=Glossina palpalis gambiensis TaxID=67801 RepID=A0A1B0AV12_9MUSC